MFFKLLIIICFVSVNILYANILPHRAHYNIELRHVNKNSDIEKVKGKMIFELKKEKKGWSISQESVTSIALKSGESETLVSNYVAFESNDGKKLDFQSSKTYDMAKIDQIKGNADFTKTGGFVKFKKPLEQKFNFVGAVLPPISHIRSIL